MIVIVSGIYLFVISYPAVVFPSMIVSYTLPVSSSVNVYAINFPSWNVGTFSNFPNHLVLSFSSTLALDNVNVSLYTSSSPTVPFNLTVIVSALLPSWLFASFQILVTGISLFRLSTVLIAVNLLSE